MEITPGVVIWRIRGAEHLIRCVVEEFGEGCFELRVLSGHELLLSESFQETAPLLARAKELRSKYAPPEPPGSTGTKSRRKPDGARNRKIVRG